MTAVSSSIGLLIAGFQLQNWILSSACGDVESSAQPLDDNNL